MQSVRRLQVLAFPMAVAAIQSGMFAVNPQWLFIWRHAARVTIRAARYIGKLSMALGAFQVDMFAVNRTYGIIHGPVFLMALRTS